MHQRSLLASAAATLLMLCMLAACEVVAPAASPAAAVPSAAVSATPSALPSPSPSPVGDAASSALPSPSPSVAAIPEGGSLAIRIPGDIATLQPWNLSSRSEEYVADLLYNGLLRLDARLQPQADLAEDWEVSPDGGLITFTLRSDARWHDGEPLTVDDAVWTLNTLRTITPTNSLLFDLRTYIGEVRSPLTDTLVLSLTQPYAPLLSELTVPILPRHRLAERTAEQLTLLDFLSEPVGSGPFRFEAREPGQSLAFIRNEAYFGEAPNLDQVALVVAPDPAVVVQALRDAQLSVAEFAPDETLGDLGGLQSGDYVENGWYGIVFNLRPERLFADRSLRQALALAVDVPALVRATAGPSAEPIASTISLDSWALPDGTAPLVPNADQARQLLDQAGWVAGPDGVRQRDGRALSARMWVRGDDARRVAVAQRIAEAAALVGMQLEVVPANFDTVVLGKLAPPYDFDLLLGSWVNAPNTAGYPTTRFYDPDDYALFHSSRVWTGQGDTRSGLRNVGGFQNAEYDAAAESARAAYDLDARRAAIDRAQAVLRAELPYLLLWTDRYPVIAATGIGTEDGPPSLGSPRLLWNIERWFVEN